MEKGAGTLIKKFIWDFDGTLFDTYPAMVDGAWRALQDFGIVADKKELYFVMKKYSTSQLRQNYQLSEEKFTPLFHQYETKSREVSAPFQDTKTVLENLKARGGRHFILTHRLTDSTWRLLKDFGLDELIESVVGIDQEFPRKPDPSSLNAIIQNFHLQKVESMMIGDRRLDIEAGNNAGITTCLYDIDYFLGDIPATYVVNELKQIIELPEII